MVFFSFIFGSYVFQFDFTRFYWVSMNSNVFIGFYWDLLGFSRFQ